MRLLMLDTVMRLIGIGQLLLIALVVGRSAAPRALRAATALLLLSIAAYLANSAPLFRRELNPYWAIIPLGSNLAGYLLWLFAHLLFERPVSRTLAAASLIVLIACWAIFMFVPYELGWAWTTAVVQHIVSLLLVGHGLAIAVAERGDDLIEKRRRFRVAFVLIVGLQALAVVVAEMWFGFRQAPGWLMLAQSTLIVLATLATGAALLDADAELLLDPTRAPPAQPALSPSEHVLRQKLDAAMAGGGYREPGLTIGGLAERLGAPEHRLRTLINRRLGYRNFSAFLNAHRLAEAKTLLADSGKVDLPILTIAMDLGYGSLAPFNRAFREAEGQAPSDFRRAAIFTAEKS